MSECNLCAFVVWVSVVCQTLYLGGATTWLQPWRVFSAASIFAGLSLLIRGYGHTRRPELFNRGDDDLLLLCFREPRFLAGRPPLHRGCRQGVWLLRSKGVSLLLSKSCVRPEPPYKRVWPYCRPELFNRGLLFVAAIIYEPKGLVCVSCGSHNKGSEPEKFAIYNFVACSHGECVRFLVLGISEPPIRSFVDAYH
nr:hypothetical protein [Tanacetum cinerariifolium]